ncbi:MULTISPECIES: hypothetical protein [Paenibacillus]|uniref:hypothetical protein n=1 Tax=Paenibacillus TaxID=44249 RepID=UPI0009A5BC2A|nr:MULTISPECIES: hypothetical protein [Paenibacillus]MCZ1269056.1 hypothetical protein [Paenibacillus tundrae]SLK16379.1 hypothetical protein SAMN06272722_110150 [Paenibacillus sp. RU5A]SOC74356.1 hypothetical protein SAMN05880581_110150 [Paenibacillus sp. RU26A]SOC76477.1 hypothetical protein SAMN05880586_110150 [Paenibacillus sp. RU5M]
MSNQLEEETMMNQSVDANSHKYFVIIKTNDTNKVIEVATDAMLKNEAELIKDKLNSELDLTKEQAVLKLDEENDEVFEVTVGISHNRKKLNPFVIYAKVDINDISFRRRLETCSEQILFYECSSILSKILIRKHYKFKFLEYSQLDKTRNISVNRTFMQQQLFVHQFEVGFLEEADARKFAVELRKFLGKYYKNQYEIFNAEQWMIALQ